MANNQNLKDAIAAVIKTNGNNEITGQLMQDALFSIINQFGEGSLFKGVAAPNTSPGVSDINLFYIAGTPGVYVNFGAYEVKSGELVLFNNISGSWQGVVLLNGLATKNDIEKVKGDVLLKSEYLERSNNIVDPECFSRGYWRFSGENIIWDNSINQLSAVNIDISQGDEFTVSGTFTPSAISSEALRFVFLDSDKNYISHILGNGSPVQSFVKPEGAVYLSTRIANVINIGLTPSNNSYAHSFMINTGLVPMPYEPYYNGIDPAKINFNFDGIVTEDSLSKLRSIQDVFEVRPSNNLINKNTDIVLGQIVISPTTNAISRNTSANWISTLPINISGGEYYLQGLRVFGASGAGNTRIVFANNNGEYISHLTDTDLGRVSEFGFTTPWGEGETGNVYINIANVVGIGNDPSNNVYADTIMLNKGGKKPYEPASEVVLIDASHVKGLSPSESDMDKIIITKSSDNIIMLYFNTGGNAGLWFGVAYRRFTNTARFIDVWRLDTGNVYRRLGEYQFEKVFELVQTGVWENAIYTTEPDYTNALGSSHGWEMLDNLILKMDGQVFDVGMNGNFKCSVFEAETATNLMTFDGTQSRATSVKKWTVRNGVIDTSNIIEWEMLTGIGDRSFVAMCPVNRKDGDLQVTNRAMRNPDWDLLDVSEAGFVNPLSADKNNLSNTIFIEGFLCSVEMLIKKATPVLPKRGFWVQNTELYNKLYFQLGETTVNPSDIWEVEAQYLIKIK